MGVTVNEKTAARDAFLETYRQLALKIDDAEARKAELKADPTKADDPLIDAYVRWLNVFEDEIGAVQAFAQAAEATSLPAEDFRVAREVATKLGDILDGGLRHVLQPA